jgi:hypothetical protein
MNRQRYGHCRKCGQQIILVLFRNNRGWFECNPYIKRIRGGHYEGPGAVEYITPDGTQHFYGLINENFQGGGFLAYLPHKCGEDR